LVDAERVRYSKTLDGNPADGMLTAELPTGGSIQTPRRAAMAAGCTGSVVGHRDSFTAWRT
jgi:hypothetical protein